MVSIAVAMEQTTSGQPAPVRYLVCSYCSSSDAILVAFWFGSTPQNVDIGVTRKRNSGGKKAIATSEASEGSHRYLTIEAGLMNISVIKWQIVFIYFFGNPPIVDLKAQLQIRC